MYMQYSISESSSARADDICLLYVIIYYFDNNFADYEIMKL